MRICKQRQLPAIRPLPPRRLGKWAGEKAGTRPPPPTSHFPTSGSERDASVAGGPEISYRKTMPKVSAGLLMYRVRDGELEFLLAHPGGPFWKDRDAGAWTIPKGEINEGENPLAAARREFEEEVGLRP